MRTSRRPYNLTTTTAAKVRSTTGRGLKQQASRAGFYFCFQKKHFEIILT